MTSTYEILTIRATDVGSTKGTVFFNCPYLRVEILLSLNSFALDASLFRLCFKLFLGCTRCTSLVAQTESDIAVN